MPGQYPLDDFLANPETYFQNRDASQSPPHPAGLPVLPSQEPDFDSPDYRNIGDIDGTRKAVFDAALAAAKAIQPVSNSRYTLSVNNVKYTGPDTVSKAEHKRALMQNSYLTRKMFGDWTLTDNATGKPVSQRRALIAHIPYVSPMGTFVKNGNDYIMSYQLRLRPGVYTRKQDNGELEAHVNATGGMGHRIYLEPETGIFNVKFGQSSLPAADVLKILGATPQQLKDAWGEDLYRINAAKSDPKALNKLYTKLSHTGNATNPEEKRKAIQAAFAKMHIDPEVSQLTLGAPYSSVDPAVILASTKKLLRLNRGEAEPDSRDDMTYQSVLGPEDIIAEGIGKAPQLLRQALWKLTARGNLDRFPGGVLDKPVDYALIGSRLGLPADEINPIELMDGQYRVTRLGEGGISSLTAVPDSARNVHPSQLGFTDFLRTPESGKVGIDARFVNTLKKGKDGKIYTPIMTASGQHVWRSAQDLSKATVAFPGELNSTNQFVSAVKGGKLCMVPRQEVDYVIPHMQSTEHSVGNMVPMMSAVKGQRAVMASRMLTQALPLEKPEAPWVQSGIPDTDGQSYEEKYGTSCGAIRAPEDCRVLAVNENDITVRLASGEKKTFDLYKDMAFNRKTGFSQTPMVKPGDKLKKDQLLAKSNFTDDNGTTAVGCNAKVAYLPFRGINWEDAFVVSDSFAKRMTSTHYYKNKLAFNADTIRGKTKYLALKPGVYKKEQLDNFGSDGVIKPGSIVHTGDPLILAVSKTMPTEAQKARGMRPSFKDNTVTWDHHDDGVVTDIYTSNKGTQVVVKTKSQLQVADKLSGRYGNKGVVGAIIPDAELPTLADGTKPDLLVSPLALVSRVNAAQMHEAALGKIAAKTGKRYSVVDFDQDDLTKYVQNELKKNHMSEYEDLTDESDPDNPQKIPGVFVGNTFFMKLMHTGESKAQSRGMGGYTLDMQPSKGGADGAKRMGIMELNALLGHGATSNIADMKYVKGQENVDYWRQYMSGFTPKPKIPYVYDKFVNYLKGAGINVVKEGPKLQIMAMTGKDINKICGDREIVGTRDPRTGLNTISTVAWDDNMKTVKGGLFDPATTGGHNGNEWAYIKLETPLPNPVMEQPLRLMLGLTENKFRSIMAGKEKTQYGTGPTAIYAMAKTLNIDHELNKAREDITSGRKTFRDATVKRIGYLKTAKQLKQEPADWFTDKAPVIPPMFRPVAQLGADGLPLVTDANYLYKDLFDVNQVYKTNKKAFGDEDSGELGLALYDSFKAVTGLADPQKPELVNKGIRGLLKTVFSNSGPKYSMVQRQLLGMPVDMSGRTVIAPNPDYDMDTVGIPENIAWDAYRPLVIRRLKETGRTGMQALQEFTDHTKAAQNVLQETMESIPVLVNRAPTLHRFGFMAMYPKMVKGNHIQLNPFVCGGYGADFDGDAVQFHVPTTKEAQEEARLKMLPSRNLFSANFKNEQSISKEHLIGLYEITRPRKRDDNEPVRTFANMDDVIRAFKAGRISPTAKIRLVDDK